MQPVLDWDKIVDKYPMGVCNVIKKIEFETDLFTIVLKI